MAADAKRKTVTGARMDRPCWSRHCGHRSGPDEERMSRSPQESCDHRVTAFDRVVGPIEVRVFGFGAPALAVPPNRQVQETMTLVLTSSPPFTVAVSIPVRGRLATSARAILPAEVSWRRTVVVAPRAIS